VPPVIRTACCVQSIALPRETRAIRDSTQCRAGSVIDKFGYGCEKVRNGRDCVPFQARNENRRGRRGRREEKSNHHGDTEKISRPNSYLCLRASVVKKTMRKQL